MQSHARQQMVKTRSALVKWVSSMEWKLFVTLSFRKPITGTTCLRHFRRLLYFIANQSKSKVMGFAGTEWFQDRQGKHIHGLINYLREQRYKTYWEWWFKHYGAARFKPYSPVRGAAHYVTKYILKEDSNGSTWDFFVESPRGTIDRTFDMFEGGAEWSQEKRPAGDS